MTSADDIAFNLEQFAEAERILTSVLRAGNFAVRPALNDTGIELVNEVRRSMASTRRDPSRVYRRGRRVHVASAPGSAPAPDTGRLSSSYGWRVTSLGVGWLLEVGTAVEYAPHLEFGTSRMAPRPHLRPAVAKTAVRIGAVIAARVAKGERAAASTVGRLPSIL